MAITSQIIVFALITALLLTIAATIILSLIPTFIANRSVTPKTNTKALRIAVVGAGISGLNVGLTLLDSNLFSTKNIIIYEANSIVGGRMHTKHWTTDSQTSEWCGEYLDTNYYSMISLINRFNIQLLDTFAIANSLYNTTYYFLKRYYTTTQAWTDYKVVESTIIQQLEQIGSINYSQSNTYGRYFDNLSLYDWIEKYVPNGHQSNFGEYLDSAYLQEYGLDTQKLNSIQFLKTIDPSSQPANGPLSIYGLSDQRFRMIGGNDQLPITVAQHLTDNGIKIQLNHNLTKIVKLANKKYRLTFSNNNAYTFDHVILTIPTTTLKYVDYSQAQFDTLKQRVINELVYGTNTKVNLQFTKRFWHDESSDGVIYTDLPFLNSWEETLGQQGTTGIIVLLTGGAEGLAFNPRTGFDSISSSEGSVSTNVYIQKFLSNLDEVWFNASKYYTGLATVSAPWYDNHYLGSYPAYTLNQYSTLYGYEKQRQGNIHFAGDYTSLEYLGLMEGAVAEGARAANEIINDYK
ncbi:unnamed protein product [Adineta steineri]|uniref:Amine oxidase n=1 Tax=Adineta steineri TaxID=433720 RepID=A0A813N9W2_9BILA|nr:unnamed protein product [Adineta steineri]CAF3591686.1 unnamed protein product [Adineta steineri]